MKEKEKNRKNKKGNFRGNSGLVQLFTSVQGGVSTCLVIIRLYAGCALCVLYTLETFESSCWLLCLVSLSMDDSSRRSVLGLALEAAKQAFRDAKEHQPLTGDPIDIAGWQVYESKARVCVSVFRVFCFVG
jgi:hypothetical protein